MQRGFDIVGKTIALELFLIFPVDFRRFHGIVCAYKGGAHNGTDYDKKAYCGKANEKERGLYSRGQTRRCSLRLRYRRRGEKQ